MRVVSVCGCGEALSTAYVLDEDDEFDVVCKLCLHGTTREDEMKREVKRLRGAARLAEREGRHMDAAVLWARVAQRLARRSMVAAGASVVLILLSIVIRAVG